MDKEKLLSDLDDQVLEGAIDDYIEGGGKQQIVLVVDADWGPTIKAKADVIMERFKERGLAVTLMSRGEFEKIERDKRPDFEKLENEIGKLRHQVVYASGNYRDKNDKVPHMQRGGLQKWQLPRR